MSSVRNIERPFGRSRFGLICTVGIRQIGVHDLAAGDSYAGLPCPTNRTKSFMMRRRW